MDPIEITPEMVAEKEAYCDWKNFPKNKPFLDVVKEDPILFMTHCLGRKPWTWQYLVLKEYMNGKKNIAVCTSRQVGKEQPHSAPILTANGWTTMGDVSEGDLIIGSDGKPAKVLGKFPQGVKDVYKVTFTDGSWAECGLEHLWKVRGSGAKHWQVLSLKDMIEKRGTHPISDNAFRIPLVEPIVFQEKKHIISPYILGALLGDGSFTSSSGIGLTSADDDILNRVSRELPSGYVLNKYSEFTYGLVKHNNISKSTNILIRECKRLQLFGKQSFLKHIPSEYLFDSIPNRIALLQGLMDTDGSVYGKGTFEFSTTSEQLMKDISFLVQSLGGNVKVKQRMGRCNGCDTRVNYRVYVRIQNINPFYLKRKARKWYNIKYERTRVLKSIELVRKENSSCIMVNNKDHTYLTKDCIVTHNSRYLTACLNLWRVLFNRGWYENQSYRNSKQSTFDGIISMTEPQSMMLVDEMKEAAFAGDTYMQKYKDSKGKLLFGEKWVTNQLDLRKSTMNQLVTKKTAFSPISQSFSRSYAPTGSVRGSTFTGLFVDEAAYVEDNIIIDAALPAVNAIGSYTLFVSTPNRPEGFFYDTIDPDDRKPDNGDIARFMFTIDCIKHDDPEYYGKVMKRIESMLADGKKNTVDREYYCSFVSSDTTYFPLDKVREVFDSSIEKRSHYRDGPVVVGIDVGGKSKSHTVITVSTTPDKYGVSRRIACWRYPVKQDGDIIADVKYNILPNFQVKSIVVDSCAASQILIQNMQRLGWNVIPFEFTKKSKPDYFDRFRTRISRRLSLSYLDSTLLEEFNGYGDDMKPMKKQGTDDMIDSWMLSNVPFMDDVQNFGVFIIDKPKDGDDDLVFHSDTEFDKKQRASYVGLSRAI